MSEIKEYALTETLRQEVTQVLNGFLPNDVIQQIDQKKQQIVAVESEIEQLESQLPAKEYQLYKHLQDLPELED